MTRGGAVTKKRFQTSISAFFNGGSGNVAAGGTGYPYCVTAAGSGNMSGSTIHETNFIAPRDGILNNLAATAEGAPGAGETFTYTVMVNGVASTITCQTGGATAQRSQDSTHQVAVSLGDVIVIRVVNSAGGAQVSHSAVLEFV